MPLWLPLWVWGFLHCYKLTAGAVYEGTQPGVNCVLVPHSAIEPSRSKSSAHPKSDHLGFVLLVFLGAGEAGAEG